MFKVNNKDTRTTPLASLWYLLLTLNIFHTLFQCSIVNSEQVNAEWFGKKMPRQLEKL